MMKNKLPIQVFPDFHACLRKLGVTALCTEMWITGESLSFSSMVVPVERAVNVKERGSLFKNVIK